MKLNAVELPLTIVYQPLSAGKLKLWTHFELAFKQLGGYGVLVVANMLILSNVSYG